MERKQSELTVITKAKDLCSYVMTVTQKSPKHFRYTFVSKLQNLAYAQDEIQLEEIQQVLSSYRSHLSFGHTYKLQKKVLGEFVLRRGNKDDM